MLPSSEPLPRSTEVAMCPLYPSWVVVRRGSLHSVLGIICVLNQIEPSSNCHFVGRAGLAFMSLTALCYLLALLSSCGAMLLDILGLKLSRMTAPFLHGLVVLFTAIAVVSSCGLWVLTRHNLRTAQHPQLLGHSVVFGPSFYFCLLACALAVVATGCSYTAWAHADLSMIVCLTGTSRQRSHLVLENRSKMS